MDAVGDVPELLADVARIGPFFAVATGPVPDGGWVALRDLGADPGPLGVRIAAVRAALHTDGRVAASIAFQGLAAQVVAPLFAAVVLHGALPTPTPPTPPIPPIPTAASWGRVAVPDGRASAPGVHAADGGIADALHWRPGGVEPWLWWAGTGRLVPCHEALLGDALTALLSPLVAAVRAQVSVAERVLWGNAASAVASARRLVAAARPAAARRATEVAERLLGAPPLGPTGELRTPEPPDLGWTFRRRSCCLYHRVPGGGVCGDCVLRAPGPAHRPPARTGGGAAPGVRLDSR